VSQQRVTRITLPPAVARELRLALLTYASRSSIEYELVEEVSANGDVVVRLARPGTPAWGEHILGARKVTARR
jgi:hypothetical protein